MATATETKKRGPGRPRKFESEFERGEKPDTVERTAKVGGTDDQLDLIDVTHPADKEISGLVKRIKAEDEARGEHQTKADELRKELLEVMHTHNIKKWVKGEYEAEIKPPKPESVSVKQRDRDKPE